MSKSGPELLAKAICAPSGEKTGLSLSATSIPVARRFASPPCRSTIHRSPAKEKTIWVRLTAGCCRGIGVWTCTGIEAEVGGGATLDVKRSTLHSPLILSPSRESVRSIVPERLPLMLPRQPRSLRFIKCPFWAARKEGC